MKKNIAVLGVALTFFFFVVCQNVRAEDPVKDAKAAYAKLVKAAKAKNVAEAKKYIVKDYVKEMEKERVLNMLLELLADLNPNPAKAELKGNRVILKIDKDRTDTFHMVKEDGQWKLGTQEEKK
jgi:predicted lipid-binding transport protein (Tim44 family)